MNLRVRFEDEADAEYRAAGRWYEERRVGLGLEFFDEVDVAITQVLELPRAGERVQRMPADMPVRRAAVKRFPYHVFYLKALRNSASLPSLMTAVNPATGRFASGNAVGICQPNIFASRPRPARRSPLRFAAPVRSP